MYKPVWLDKGGRELHAEHVIPALVVEGVIESNRCVERCLGREHLAKTKPKRDRGLIVMFPIDGGSLVGPAPIAPIGVNDHDRLKREQIHNRLQYLTLYPVLRLHHPPHLQPKHWSR